MFTGIVETQGTVYGVETDDAGRTLTVAVPALAAESKVGDSIAVNGVCLTAVDCTADHLRFQVGPETLKRTNLEELVPGDSVNLERALRLSDRLGGHVMQGHVDGVGRVADRQQQGDWEIVWFSCPTELTRFMVPKGSVAVDGVSLTLVEVTDDGFSVALIPHTLDNTTLGFKPVGAAVNLETDILAKYVERLLASRTSLPNHPTI
jgi:riboflavin synthase